MFLIDVAQWFGARKQRAVVRRRRPMTTAALRLEGLESREVPALFALSGQLSAPVHRASFPMGQPAVNYQVQSLGDKMAEYLQAQVNAGRRIGGGACGHLATEALRAAGADFTRTEPDGTLDYVWTSNRVARLTHGSQVAGKQFRVGDVIQYHNATFSDRGDLAHHTQVVAAVDWQGHITEVFEQNVDGNRTALRRAAPDLTRLTGGSVSVYRPVQRVTQPGLVECTIVNNTNASLTGQVQIGTGNWGFTLDAANTDGSYQTRGATFSGTARPTLTFGNVSVVIEDGAAYELYSLPGGQVGIRKT